MSKRPELLNCTELERINILKFYNRTPETVKIDIEHINQWISLQLHLPKDIFTNRKIELFLLLNKFSTEKTKEKLENYCTIRQSVPEIYKDKEPFQPCMIELRKVIYWLPLPRLTKDLYRPIVFCVTSPRTDCIDAYSFFAHAFSIAEIRLDYDYALGEISVWDFNNVTVSHLTKFTPMAVKKAVVILEKVFSSRVKGFHFINCPKALDKFIKFVKSFMKQKLASRIFVHKDVKSLHKFVPQELLPLEYGGKMESIHAIQAKWNAVLEEYKPWFEKLQNMCMDETQKPTKATNDELLGFHGSFRKLSVD